MVVLVIRNALPVELAVGAFTARYLKHIELFIREKKTLEIPALVSDGNCGGFQVVKLFCISFICSCSRFFWISSESIFSVRLLMLIF